MTQHSIEEAETEVVAARAFGREPAPWAARRVAQGSGDVSQDAVREAVLDVLISETFGREPSAASVEMADRGAEAQVANFMQAGLTRESAVKAAAGLLRGHYVAFEDAALAQTGFSDGNKPLNPLATPQRIAEVAGSLGEDVKTRRTILEGRKS
jgi:hypothetical protein